MKVIRILTVCILAVPIITGCGTVHRFLSLNNEAETNVVNFSGNWYAYNPDTGKSARAVIKDNFTVEILIKPAPEAVNAHSAGETTDNGYTLRFKGIGAVSSGQLKITISEVKTDTVPNRAVYFRNTFVSGIIILVMMAGMKKWNSQKAVQANAFINIPEAAENTMRTGSAKKIKQFTIDSGKSFDA